MKKLSLLILFAAVSFAQTAFRVDPTPVYTTSSNVPPGAYTPMLAIGGAAIAVNTTTYTDSTGAVPCPSNAQVTVAGTSGCVATATAQGAFGFWVLPGSYVYTVTLPSGQVLGPYPVTVGGGGGGGTGCTPGGITGSLQFNNGAGGCSGSGSLVWNGSSLSITGSLSTSGAISTVSTQFNAIMTPAGGFQGLSGSFTNYVKSGSFTGASLTATSGDSITVGAIAWSITNSCESVFNGSSMVCIGGGGGGGTPGGPNTSIQFNNAGAFGGNANFFWDNVNRLLTVNATSTANAGIAVGTGFMQADRGFNATSGTCNSYNCLQAATGGGAALSWSATKYVQTGDYTGAAPTATTGDTIRKGTVSYSNTNSCEAFYDGTVWACLSAGSATTPGGATTNVQFNNAGAFGGSANFTWNNAGQLLTVNAASSASAGIAVGTGFMQADRGFVATSGTCNSFNCLQAPTGGMAAKNFSATVYIQPGTFAGAAPTVTSGDTFATGAISYSSTNNCVAYFNGITWPCITAGGGGAVSAIIGTANQVLANGTSGSSQTGAVTLTLPQSINTTATVNFGNVVSAGVFQSNIAAGAGIAFQVANGLGTPVQIDGSGDASFNGSVNALGNGVGSLAPYRVNGTAVIDASRNGTFGVVTTSGVLQSQATGTNFTFANTNFNFLVNGNGAVSAAGVFNSTGSGGGFNASASTQYNSFQNAVGGGMRGRNITADTYMSVGQNSGNPSMTTGDTLKAGVNYWDTSTSKWTMYTSTGGYQGLINNVGTFVGAGVDVGTFGVQAIGYNVTGGYLGQTWTIGLSSPFTINGSGSFTSLVFRGGVLVSAF